MTIPAAKHAKPPPAAEAPAAARGDAEIVRIPREELQALIHDLRNHLNSLLMNAGVLAAACQDRQRYGRYIDQVEQEGERCAEALRGLSDRHL
jgi:signal transduction histidine kinase